MRSRRTRRQVSLGTIMEYAEIYGPIKTDLRWNEITDEDGTEYVFHLKNCFIRILSV